tara:strand:- start:203 stop:664 length:462 start_codon:yes stop_codon:yes gene_type:complete
MNMEIVKQFALLTARKKKLEDELRSVKDEMAAIEPAILQELVDNQLDRLPVVTGGGDRITVFIHRQAWVRPKDGNKEAVVKTLKKCGLSDFVSESYNTNSLSAYVRERLANGLDLQPTLKAVVRIDEVTSIRGKRSPASSDSQTAKAMRNLRG